MTFPRLATLLCCGIAVLQGLTVLLCRGTPTPASTLIPLRPSLAREADALTIADEPPRDEQRCNGNALAAGIERMNRIPSLALSASQRRTLLATLRRLMQQRGPDRRPAQGISTFRRDYMRVTLAILEVLRAEQVRFIVENRQDFYVTFEASYWPYLVAKLEATPAPRERPSSSLHP